MPLAFPFAIAGDGRSARAGGDAWLRQMIGQVLFTAPGERVMRPDFGCGLGELVFAPNSPELAATVQFLVQGALQRWLGHLIEVAEVAVAADDSRLTVSVTWRRRGGEAFATDRFERASA